MTDYTEKKCPGCGQKLRIPQDIGGMLMACPSCGEKFHSDFRLGSGGRRVQQNMLLNVFEMPGKIVSSIGRYFFPK